MEFCDCSIAIDLKKTVKIVDPQFVKLFSEAALANPNYMAFDLDLDYEGRIGGTGAQVSKDELQSGDYSVTKVTDSEYKIEAKCTMVKEFMFMNAAGKEAFKNALKHNTIRIFICSVCNNGQNKKTFWSMECDPYIELEAKEVSVKLK